MIISEPEKVREQMIKEFSKYIKSKTSCRNLEKAIYNWSIDKSKENKIITKWSSSQFCNLYTSKLFVVLSNLSPDSGVNNTYLSDQINSGHIKSYKVPYMTHQQLFPERWDQIIKMKIERDKSKYEINIEATTSEFKCWKCKGRKCTY